MIEGTVNSAYEATIPLRVHGADGHPRDFSAVVDTGFSGFLTLPLSLVAELDLPFAFFGRAILADDTEVSFDIHYVTISWDGRQLEIQVAASGSTPLVGMMLLDGHDLNIRVRDGGEVTVEASDEK